MTADIVEGHSKSMKRIQFLDYAKAFGIFCVVSIHVGFYQVENIVLFAMPVFFATAGFNFDPAKRTLKETLALRFKTILLPFWGFMAFYAALEFIRGPLFGYGSWELLFASLAKMIYGSGVIPAGPNITAFLKEVLSYKAQTHIGADVILPLNCPLWYLPAMFTGYVMFASLVEQTRKNHWIKAISVIVLLLVASVEVVFPSLCQLPYGIGRGAIGAAFMLVGFWIKDSGAFEKTSVKFHGLTGLLSLIIYVSSIFLGSNGSAMVRSYYGPYGALSVFITFIGGTAGIWLTFEVCRGLEKLPIAGIKRLLSFVGRNVIVVYSLHMGVKFLLDAIYIVGLHRGDSQLLDQYMMGLLPDQSFWYMIFEVVVILAVCLLAAQHRSRVRHRKHA